MHASVPLEQSRTFSIDGIAAHSASANSTSRSVGAPKLVPSAAARWIASITAGCACPSSIGPQEPT